MYFFLIILLAGAFTEAVFKLSAMSRGLRFFILLLIFLPMYLLHPWAAGINMGSFKDMISDSGTLNTSCTVVILQAITCILFMLFSLNTENSKNKQAFFGGMALLPSLLFPAGIFVAMVCLFNNIRLVDFRSTALLFCGMLPVTLFVLCEILNFAVAKKLKNELIFTFQLLLIFTAMFFPVIRNGKRACGGFPEMTAFSLLLNSAMILTAALSGSVIYLWEKRKHSMLLNGNESGSSGKAPVSQMEAG